ncbi:hypothetical protein Y032_0207g2001 [Ancylostoma ceylanicum]|uniref:Uncharacterized protein n=1 Tax=Ancylostoma ceylanicum TaxID=53326 RepID=A0A016SKP2_9BILA|nr:hypothetical protein Y032_0207g2001 [Ancylostoma ceylanicum]
MNLAIVDTGVNTFTLDNFHDASRPWVGAMFLTYLSSCYFANSEENFELSEDHQSLYMIFDVVPCFKPLPPLYA